MKQANYLADTKAIRNSVHFIRLIYSCLIIALLSTPALVKAALLSTDLLTQIQRDSGATILEDPSYMQGATGPLVDSVGLQTSAGSPSLVDASSSASVELDYGLFRGQTSVFLEYGGVNEDVVWSSINAIWNDGVTINGGTAGTDGILNVRIFVSGTGSAQIPGSPTPSGFDLASSGYAVQLLNNNNPWSEIGGGWISSEDGPYVGDPLGQEYVLSTQFTFGQTWDLGLAIYLQSQITLTGGTMGTYSSEINLSNTVGWLGIDSITDEFGNPISSFTITSESGFDWSSAHPSAVPIPPSVWLFGSGLLGLIGIARRKKAA